MRLERFTGLLPARLRNQLDPYLETALALREIRDLRVLRSLGPSAVRGLLLARARPRPRSRVPADFDALFDWTYPKGGGHLGQLYETAKRKQWQARDLGWRTSVDPVSPDVPLLPDDFLAFDALADLGVRLSAAERRDVLHRLCAWLLSQFLHGEQGALLAAAQVTEAVPVFDAKLFGATQVMDEARHVEVFHRYVTEKLGKLYRINDNLYVIIEALIGDRRWDMKFLGMQILVEGLALGAFATLYKQTREPLLRELLRSVMRDESRHVQFGVASLRQHFSELSERERREREAWAFEVALLMRDRFMVYELYDEYFAGTISRAEWRQVIDASPGMREFRLHMFRRLVPNLRAIGLLGPAIAPRYERAGLMVFYDGPSADQLGDDQLIRELE